MDSLKKRREMFQTEKHMSYWYELLMVLKTSP